MSLPEPKLGEKIVRKDFDCIEQAWLMGFLVHQGVASPGLKVSPFAADGIATQKKNISSQLFKIKNWEIREGDYKDIEDVEATWYVDPPYQVGGYKYKHNKMDFPALADWCKSRRGQVIVCENTKADWLPFKPMITNHGAIFTTTEAIWSNLPTAFDNEQISMDFG